MNEHPVFGLSNVGFWPLASSGGVTRIDPFVRGSQRKRDERRKVRRNEARRKKAIRKHNRKQARKAK